LIVLLETLHPDAEAILRAVDDVVLSPSPTTLPDVAGGEINALVTRGLGRITAATIDSLPALRVVARCGAGLDNVDTAAAHARGVAVVYAPGITTGAVAEHALMLALCLARQTVRLAEATARGEWAIRDGFLSTELRGRRAGIVGLGSIGSRVAELSAALGMDVVGWTRRHRPDSAVAQVGFDELLATSDVIQLCVALTPDTAGLIGTDALATMRPGALLVNTARGQLVDLPALAAALEQGHLGGYATDVWDPEPPTAGTPLLDHPRVLVTPHVAAFTDATYRELCVGPAEAIAAVLRGEAPQPRFVLASPRLGG
jgi:phosphoglycerate dehydrogenase-like enzyme